MTSAASPADTRAFIVERLVGDTGEPEQVEAAARSLAERTVPAIMRGLEESVATSITIEVASIELCRFVEARPGVTNHAMTIAASTSSPDALVLSIDNDGLAVLVSTLFGGDPHEPVPPIERDLSPLEIDVATMVFEQVAQAMNGSGPRAFEFKLPLPLAVTGKDIGIHDYADLAKHKDELGGKIYGIEAGSSANATIQSMITKDKFGLKKFELVESSEQAMLSQVQNAVRKNEPIVFFAWTPHPMNIRYKLTYLEHGDNVFGPNDGAATVETLTRKGFKTDCPNVSRFVSNLKFDTHMESTMMNMILNDGMDAKTAVTKWVKDNPAKLDAWLDGVTTFDGKPALPVVKAGLGL